MTAPTNLPQSLRDNPPTTFWAALAVSLRVFEQSGVPPVARERQAVLPNAPSQVPSEFGQDIEIATSAMREPDDPDETPVQLRELALSVVDSAVRLFTLAKAELAYLRRLENAS